MLGVDELDLVETDTLAGRCELCVGRHVRRFAVESPEPDQRAHGGVEAAVARAMHVVGQPQQRDELGGQRLGLERLRCVEPLEHRVGPVVRQQLVDAVELVGDGARHRGNVELCVGPPLHGIGRALSQAIDHLDLVAAAGARREPGRRCEQHGRAEDGGGIAIHAPDHR